MSEHEEPKKNPHEDEPDNGVIAEKPSEAEESDSDGGEPPPPH